jgi:signal transduction histidine kinase
MSLFWRLALGFAIAVLAAVAVQRGIAAIDSNTPLLPKLAVLNSPLTKHQGQAATKALRERGRDAALGELAPIHEMGLDAWLITLEQSVGPNEPPKDLLDRAKAILQAGGDSELSFGQSIHLVGPPGEKAALIVVAPGTSQTSTVAIRVLALVLIPILVCLGLARLLALPIQRLGVVALRYAEGDFSLRAEDKQGSSEVRDLARSLNSMAGRVDETLTDQKRMLRDVSHEVRSPLARIRLATQMLREGKGSQDSNLARIECDVVRLDELVEDLAMVAKTGHTPAPRVQIDLGLLVSEVADDVRLELEARGNKVETVVEALLVQGDKKLLVSAIENLVRNAVIHSPAGSTIVAAVDAGRREVTVSDAGPGVPESELERIFEPFYRIEDSRDRGSGGTGLGLAIVKQVATLHGAEALAKNRPEGGLAVTIRFP